MEAGTDPPRSIPERLHINRRWLQIALGVFWIVDGLLNFSPPLEAVLRRYRHQAHVHRPAEPGGIGHRPHGEFLSHEATMWVVVFGLVEVAIGAGMLFTKTVKPALVASFIWGAGVYLFGEGLGMVLTGHTSPLAGAPGAVCFYVLLGVMVWPSEERDPVAFPPEPIPPSPAGASSAAPARCWCGRRSGSSRPSSGCSRPTAPAMP